MVLILGDHRGVPEASAPLKVRPDVHRMEPKRVPSQTKRFEYRFEQWLWRFRLVAILPVLFSLASTGITFVLGTNQIIMAIFGLGGDHSSSKEYLAHLLGGVVTGIDLYLIGIALLIFGYGVYELLISPIDAARSVDHAGEGLLHIRDLDQLKEKLVKVLVVALIVSAFKAMLALPITDGPSLAFFCVGVLLLAVSGFLVTGDLGKHQKSRH